MRDVSEEILSLFVAIRFQGSSTKPCPNENRLIREGRFADCVDELIQKVITAKRPSLINRFSFGQGFVEEP